MNTKPNKRTIVFIGTYNRGNGAGIYVYELNTTTGAMVPLAEAGGINNPSFLVLSRDGRFLYTACEAEVTGGKPGGAVAAFAVDAKTFALKAINVQPSHGRGPCHVNIDPGRRILMVANYSEGNVASYPIRGDGSIGEAGSVIQHTGTSADKSRQEGPHAHSITVDPAGRYAFSADLGIDKIFCYKLDPAAGKMTPGETPSTAVTPGAGPRHFAFTPDGRFAYVINELDSTVIAYAYEGAAGKLNQLQIVTTLPHDWKGTNYPADIHVSPDSRFVYGSNRGHNSLAIFAVDRTRGTLTAVGHEPTRGQHPRGFNISPRGDFLLAANQDTSNLLTFRVDAQTGKLSVAGQIIVMPRPVCVQMIEV